MNDDCDHSEVVKNLSRSGSVSLWMTIGDLYQNLGLR